MQQLAAATVSQAAACLQPSEQHLQQCLQGIYSGEADQIGVLPTLQLNTQPVNTHSRRSSQNFFSASSNGIVLFEPFGGMCSGLEMCLRNGIQVIQYLYADTDPDAQAVASHRMQQLHQQYPKHLPDSAIQHSMQLLPANVQQINSEQLFSIAASHREAPWLVVGGFPCQEFSMAGPSRGLQGSRSQLLFSLISIIGTLQQLLPVPPAYIIENVAFQHHSKPSIAEDDFNKVCQLIGTPVSFDAAQLGSLAHRIRNYWTNLCSVQQLQASLQLVKPPAGRTVNQILPQHRVPMPVSRPDREPQYPINYPGQPRAVWPTLMGRTGSYAFRPGQPGSLLDISDPRQPVWTEPTAEEREQALGYLIGSTAVPGLSQQQRSRILGQAMDANALQFLMAVSLAWWKHSSARSIDFITPVLQGLTRAHQQCTELLQSQHCSSSAAPLSSSSAAATYGGSYNPPVGYGLLAASSSHRALPFLSRQEYLPTYTQLCTLAASAAAAEHPVKPLSGSVDICTDNPAMATLQQGQHPAGLSKPERWRITKRLRDYCWIDGHLYRHMSDGSTRQVPPPDQRKGIIMLCHEKYGHFGVRRTAAQLLLQFWWGNLVADVRQVVSQCLHCSRERAAFVARPRELQSIPISTAGFRWHADLAEDLPVTVRGNQHVLVAIEAFTKFLVATPLKDKTAATASVAFTQHVLAVFAAPGMVVTDSGAAFGTEFSQMLADALVEHSNSSPYHPQANGQAEKAVHIVKASLKRMASSKHSTADWDLDVSSLVMGYNCSPSLSTRFAPYLLMFAREPVISPYAQLLNQPIDYDCPETAQQDLLQRQQLVKRYMPAALQNLAIAQHRDQLRYLRGKAAASVTFAVGDFVYRKNHQINSPLQPAAKPNILRIVSIKDSGVCQLQGRCGTITECRVEEIAPCHLQLDGTIDPALQDNVEDIMCEVCGTDELADRLLLCELCNQGWHTFCLSPPLATVPEGLWICPDCTAAGKTEADALKQQQRRQQQQQQQPQPNIFPDAAMRRRDEAAAKLHGRLISRMFKDPLTKKPTKYLGRLHYRGPLSRPYYFRVVYEDGDMEDLSMARVKGKLLPESRSLPAGVSIPEPATLAMAQQQLISCVVAAASTTRLPLAAAEVSLDAATLLVEYMQHSLDRPLHDHITQNQSLVAAMQQLGLTVSTATPTAPYFGLITAPTAEALTQCLTSFKQLQAEWIACCLPCSMDSQQRRLVSIMSAHCGSAILMQKKHRWLILG